MRLSMLIAGTAILLVSFLLLQTALSDSDYLIPTIFGFSMAGVNLAFGLVTRKSGGVSVAENLSGPVKMSVDKGVMGSAIYLMAFSDKKLVLKRLASARITLFIVLLLAVLGFAIVTILGAAIGGLTAFSVQEFVTQRRRNVVEKGNVLDGSQRGDLEFQYSDMEKVELGRNRLRLYFSDRIMRIVISRRYPDKMRPALIKILGSKETDELASSGKSSKKEDHQRNHA
ncbi:MAG TPA: hypothetical protein VFV92_13540 [Candidatus Bathyarchaeia archaeon]|nr:hypothetical protein [Candidatus Bathyarchaeia archaeon]